MKKWAGLTLVALLGCAMQAKGIVIAEDTWGGAGIGFWQIEDDFGGTAYGALSNPGGFLEITGGAADILRVDRIFRTLGSAGDSFGTFPAAFTNVGKVMFDFYVDPSLTLPAPSQLSVYFHDATTGTNWFYDVNVGTLGLNRFEVSLSPAGAGNWYNEVNPAAPFSDLTSIDEVGIRLTYQSGVGAQVYLLDRFQLDDGVPVPEPQTYATLGFAFLSLGMTFRRKLQASLENLKKRTNA